MYKYKWESGCRCGCRRRCQTVCGPGGRHGTPGHPPSVPTGTTVCTESSPARQPARQPTTPRPVERACPRSFGNNNNSTTARSVAAEGGGREQEARTTFDASPTRRCTGRPFRFSNRKQCTRERAFLRQHPMSQLQLCLHRGPCGTSAQRFRG